jgi:hypothetical protein
MCYDPNASSSYPVYLLSHLSSRAFLQCPLRLRTLMIYSRYEVGPSLSNYKSSSQFIYIGLWHAALTKHHRSNLRRAVDLDYQSSLANFLNTAASHADGPDGTSMRGEGVKSAKSAWPSRQSCMRRLGTVARDGLSRESTSTITATCHCFSPGLALRRTVPLEPSVLSL